MKVMFNINYCFFEFLSPLWKSSQKNIAQLNFPLLEKTSLLLKFQEKISDLMMYIQLEYY